MAWIFFSLLLPIFGAKIHQALFLGLVLATVTSFSSQKLPFIPEVGNKEATFSKRILQFAVAILGLCLPLTKLLSLGLYGLAVTFVSISLVLLLGIYLGKILGIQRPLVSLISFGTAICGGSAIAALAPSIRAKNQDIAVSLVIVFMLNALALFLFPPIGQYFALNDIQFGKWVALSIHDTSSVVAASALWSKEALTTATTLKLIRALWIVPFTFFFASRNNDSSKLKVPSFILAFVFLSIMASIFPWLMKWETYIKELSKMLMTSSLFLIGLSLKPAQIKKIPLKILVYGFSLWIIIIALTLVLISYKFI